MANKPTIQSADTARKIHKCGHNLITITKREYNYKLKQKINLSYS